MLLVETYISPSPVHGTGLYAKNFIAKGTPIARYVAGMDLRLSRESYLELPDLHKRFIDIYGYGTVDEPNIIYVCLDNGRFMNHSDTPNVDDSDIISVAARDIQAGEELTTNYAVLCGTSAAIPSANI
jgi:uncharacterized protein